MKTPIWSPLRSATSTRLLVLHPAQTDDDNRLDASLMEISLDDANVEYEAISYTWGDQQRQQIIFIDGEEILIRENLWRFLKRLTGSNDRLLWVDALCIDQNNAREKSQQVNIIGRIFRGAVRVLAWLGEHADGSEELFRRLAGDGQPPGDPEERSEAGAESEALGRGQAEDSLTQSEQEARLKLWEAFLERPWFGRTWIIQEVVLAKSLVLHCGPDTLVWERLPPCEKLETFDGIHHLLKSRSHSGYRRGEFRLGQLQDRRRRQMTVPAWNKDNFRHSSSIVRWYTDLSNTIGHLALTFSDWKCTDRRDKIYALLSLEDRTPLQKSIHPDYTLSIEDTFLSVFRRRCGGLWRTHVARRNALADAEEAVATFALTLADALGLNDQCIVLSLLERGRDCGQDEHVWMAAISKFGKKIAASTPATDAEMTQETQQPG